MLMSRRTATAIAMVLLMTSVTFFAIQVQGQVQTIGGAPNGTSGASIPLPAGVTPDYTTIAYAYLSARPNQARTR